MKSSAPRQLFAGQPLRNAMDRGLEAAYEKLNGWNPEVLLNASEDSIVDELLRKATVELSALLREQAYLEEPISGLVTRFTLVVPYAGPMMSFDMTVTSPGLRRNWIACVGTRPPYAEIHSRFLRLYSFGGSDATKVRADFDRQLDQIEQFLGMIRAEAEAHNQRMAHEIPAVVAQRRAKLLADRNVQSSIGYPTKYRPDTVSYSGAVRRDAAP